MLYDLASFRLTWAEALRRIGELKMYEGCLKQALQALRAAALGLLGTQRDQGVEMKEGTMDPEGNKNLYPRVCRYGRSIFDLQHVDRHGSVCGIVEEGK